MGAALWGNPQEVRGELGWGAQSPRFLTNRPCPRTTWGISGPLLSPAQDPQGTLEAGVRTCPWGTGRWLVVLLAAPGPATLLKAPWAQNGFLLIYPKQNKIDACLDPPLANEI